MLRSRLPSLLARSRSVFHTGFPAALHVLGGVAERGPAARERDVSWRTGAAFTASALVASAMLSTRAVAEEPVKAAAAAAVPAPPLPPKDPASVLQGLASIADAKEVVLYQYEVCPFCNKARRERHAQTTDSRATAAARLPGLPQDSVPGGGGEPADQEGAEVVHVWQSAESARALRGRPSQPLFRCLCSWWTASS